jgi:hypothetical protein
MIDAAREEVERAKIKRLQEKFPDVIDPIRKDRK